MQLHNAFLLATAFAYLACIVYTIQGKPPLVGVSEEVQMAFYLIAFGVLTFATMYTFPSWLNLVLGVVYSFGCAGSFIGWPQRWKAYWTFTPDLGSAAQQVMMAMWDLALAVCFFTLC